MLGLAAGCHKLLGLDPVPPPTTNDSAIDGPQTTVQATRERHHIANDQSNSPTAILVPYGAGEVTVTARLADGTSVPVAWDPAAGTATFTVPQDATYALAFATVDTTVEYQTSSAMLATGETIGGRVDEAFPTMATANSFQLMFSAALPASASIVTSGVYWEAAPNVPSPGAYVAPWVGPLTNAGENDRTFFLGYETRADYSTIVYSQAFAKTLVDGQQNGTTASLTYTSPTHCHHITADSSSAMRFLVPTGFSAVQTSWSLLAIPLARYSRFAAYRLTYSPVPTPTGGVDTFYDPVIVPLTTFASIGVNSGRTAVSMANVQYPIAIGGARYVGVPDPTTCDAVETAMTVAIPSEPILDGVPLTTDNLTIRLDADLTTLSWTDAVPGDVDTYLVQIIVPTPNMYSYATVRSIYTRDHQVLVDPAIFANSQDYFILVHAITGAPGVMSGDFATFSEIDQQEMTMSSHLFRVSR